MKIIRPLSISLAWLAAVFLSLSAIAQPASEGKVTYFINDLLGSPVVAMEQSGAVIWRESFSGYGERKNQPADTAQSARAANKVWYTSRHQDEDTGLVYMGARYYDPALGRFLSVDPVHFVETNPHSFNRYAYANNNPYKYVDPDGRTPLLQNLVAKAAEITMRYSATVTAVAADLGGINGTLSSFPAVSSSSRALVAADLGIQGKLTQLSGTISKNGGTLNVAVDMIEGNIKNNFEVIPKLIENATSQGATEIRIQATFANEGLQNILTKRYGFELAKGEGKYQDALVKQISVNQIPKTE